MSFKLGRKPARKLLSMPSLGDFLDKAALWPPVPAQGWENAVAPATWGVLGNDQYGCCAEAGILHLIQGQSANTGNPLSATTAQALALYSAVTGFNPSDPLSDRGGVMLDIMNNWRKEGFGGYPLDGFAAIDTHYGRVRAAVAGMPHIAPYRIGQPKARSRHGGDGSLVARVVVHVGPHRRR